MSINNSGKPANKTLAARIERAAQMVYVLGSSEKEVAEALGIKPATLRDWRRRPEWNVAISRLRDEQAKLTSDRLTLMTDKAVTAIDQSLESQNQTVRLKAAMWVLERSDLGPPPNAPSEFELYVRGNAGGGA